MNRKYVLCSMGIVALAFGAFWHIWNLFAGNIPAVSELVMLVGNEQKASIVWQLPFAISYSWNVLLAPLFVLVSAWLVCKTNPVEEDILFAGLTIGLVAGLAAELLVGFFLGLFYGLVIGLTFGLLAGSFVGWVFEPSEGGGLVRGLRFSVCYGLSLGFVTGTFWTMPVGIVVGLFVALPPILILLLISAVKEVLSSLSGRTEGTVSC